MTAPECSWFRPRPWNFHSVPPQHDLSRGNASGYKLLYLLIRCGHHGARSFEHSPSPNEMINRLQQKTTHDRHEHPDELKDIGNLSNPAGSCNGRPQKVIESKNVHHVKILQSCPAISLNRWIPAQRSVPKPRRQINGLNSIFVAAPSEGRSLCRDFCPFALHTFFESPIRR